MNVTVQRLQALKQAWKSIPNIPEDLTMLGLPGKSGRFIEETIDELACMAMELASVPEGSLMMIKPLCENHLKLLEAFFDQKISGHPSMQMLTFATHLLQLKTTLKEAVHDASGQTGNRRQDPAQAA